MRILSLSLVVILAAFMLTIAGFQLNASGNFSAGVNSLFQADWMSPESVRLHLTWWPRFFTTLIAGAALAAAGVLMQQVLRLSLIHI